MPELPEVETIRTQLADRLIGREIVDVQIKLPKMFEGSRDQVLGSRSLLAFLPILVGIFWW